MAVIISVLLAVTRARREDRLADLRRRHAADGQNAAESALGPSSVGSLTQRWVTDVGGVIVASPVLAARVSVGGVVTDLLY
jgi:hypothetical protein